MCSLPGPLTIGMRHNLAWSLINEALAYFIFALDGRKLTLLGVHVGIIDQHCPRDDKELAKIAQVEL